MLKIILTGATGMVGEGVLLVCLAHPEVEKVLVIGRHSSGRNHPKLTESLTKDFADLSAIEDKLAGYDTCFFCAGVSSIGKSEDEYYKITYGLTVNFAETFKKQNPKAKFFYISGYGTDSSEKGKYMWARVKGKTENRLSEIFGKNAYMFRPGYLKPTKGQRRILKAYWGWQISYPFMKLVMPKFTCTLKEVGIAMINCALNGYSKNILEVKDIIQNSEGLIKGNF
ncbi:MAG: NAD-dependent epimerase/dehydratase family protein [Chlorobi bacterium]|nr:NAD-dependent epimerase/dehydratase family protein [Chlorobiota bacterium]MCI0716585.1 NAD-dependent epimerase/dehydratase family protein [Chlorobiota bacterium]